MGDDMAHLHYLTIAEASELIHQHELSPVELTRTLLDRIQTLDAQLNAYITVAAESALKEARIAERAIIRGDYIGPLHGIPVAHKDIRATKGIRTTAHSRVLLDWVPEEDATAVARLKEAGSILLGKLACHEFATGGPRLDKPFPPARNPWNLDHVPGGSSSGSGAALAAGLCMGSLGTDTGGSMRYPASACGIVALKPTFGRVSRYGVIPLSWSLDYCGPMARTVPDVALMLQVVAGHDPKDPFSTRTPIPDYSAALNKDIHGMVLGVPNRVFGPGPVEAETMAAFENALRALEQLGAKTRRLDIPALEYVDLGHAMHPEFGGIRLPRGHDTDSP